MCTTIIGWFGVDDDDDENCSHSTLSVAHNSLSSYISATEIPLPEDAMEDDSNCLSAMERELGSQHQSLNNICNQSITLITLSEGVNPHVEAPPAVVNAVVAPLNPPNTTTHQLRPVTPSEFIGDCTKGCAFLNSCNLYIGLAPTQFPNDQARIYRVLSFMKGNKTAHFTDQTMWLAQKMGSLPWATWAEFRLKFICDFCPKNGVQTACTDLETSKYHQGSHSIDKYVDKFCELVDHTEYTKGTNIVLKFQHGLSPMIQNYITCLTYGWPANDVPKDWYNAVILWNENHIANSAFQSTLQSTQTTTITGGGAHRNPVTGVTKPVHSVPAQVTVWESGMGPGRSWFGSSILHLKGKRGWWKRGWMCIDGHWMHSSSFSQRNCFYGEKD